MLGYEHVHADTMRYIPCNLLSDVNIHFQACPQHFTTIIILLGCGAFLGGCIAIGEEAIHGLSRIGTAMQHIHVVTCACILVGGEGVLIYIIYYTCPKI